MNLPLEAREAIDRRFGVLVDANGDNILSEGLPLTYAQEIVRRVNVHDELVRTLEYVKGCADDHGDQHFGYGEFINEVNESLKKAKSL